MSKNLKYMAIATMISTLILIALGNVVTTTGSGMGCGDHWPGCNGKLIPDFTHYTVVIEFAHRAVAGPIVSLLALATTFLAWKITGPAKKAVRMTASIMLGLLALQVILGAITVKLVLPPHVVMMHLGIAMAFLGALIILVLQSLHMDNPPSDIPQVSPSFFQWVWAGTILTYLQLILGAYVRHSGSALACPDFPLCQGLLIPPSGPPLIHFFHRLGAYLVATVIVIIYFQARKLKLQNPFAKLTTIALILIGVQIILGILSVLSALQVQWTTLHITVGAGLLACMLSLVYYSRMRIKPVTSQSKPHDQIQSEKGAMVS